MNSQRYFRPKPGSGAETLKYFDQRHHDEFISKAKSSLSRDFNDKTWQKHKAHIENKSEMRNKRKEKQIDAKNLKFFIRLSSVQPNVPIVVRKVSQRASVATGIISGEIEREKAIQNQRPIE